MDEQVSHPSFSNVVLMGRPRIAGVPETLLALKDYLKSLGVTVSIEATTAQCFPTHDVTVVEPDQLPSACDLIIVVGGDGSLLSASHIALANDLPILGINRGRLGFLTDIHPNELTKIDAILNGHYTAEKRFLLALHITHQEHGEQQLMALNDVVLHPGDTAQLIEFETYINQQFVCSQRADGLIVSTPTGSTAYALSGGGPILHPKLDAITLVPMFPHTLSSRPIVIDANSKIEIVISSYHEATPFISCDGKGRIVLTPEHSICITKIDKQLQLIHPKDYNYFTTLREKLGWERHTRAPLDDQATVRFSSPSRT